MPSGPDSDEITHGTQHASQARQENWLLSPITPQRLQLPKVRSTGNLRSKALEKARTRLAFDAGSAAMDSDPLTSSPIVTGHDHGFGPSGLRRIRQQHTLHSPEHGSPASPHSGTVIPRPASMASFPLHIANTSNAAAYAEDLHRFPSESLHSFSFAHQSEDHIHNRQNVLKRGIEFMKNKKDLAVITNLKAPCKAPVLVEDVNSASIPGHAQDPSSGYSDSAAYPPKPLHPPARGNAATSAEGSEGRSSVGSPVSVAPHHSEASSRSTTNESTTTNSTSPPTSVADDQQTANATPHSEKLDTPTAQVYPNTVAGLKSPVVNQANNAVSPVAAPHGHSRWVPAAQAIFTTEAKPPWTILAANDLACLLFGVTKSEVRKMSIMEVVQEERRAWLEKKLLRKQVDDGLSISGGIPNPLETHVHAPSTSTLPVAGCKAYGSSDEPPAASKLGIRNGITAQLLNKPNSRAAKQPPPRPQPLAPDVTTSRRAQTVHGSDASPPKTSLSHLRTPSGGKTVILCGDVLPIQKRNGGTGSASMWVKEKNIGLIWVMEEIHEDVAVLSLDTNGEVLSVSGNTSSIWGDTKISPGMDIGKLVWRIPRTGSDKHPRGVDFHLVSTRRYFTCRNCDRVNIPAAVDANPDKLELRISSLPHIAGIVVIDPQTLVIQSSNTVFSAALFGYEKLAGMSIMRVIPNFDRILRVLLNENGVHLHEGVVVPEHSFRKVSAFLALRDGQPEAATAFLRPDGLIAQHRDGLNLKIDIQMRVVRSDRQASSLVEARDKSSTSFEIGPDPEYCAENASVFSPTASVTAETVFALWITYARHCHATRANLGAASPLLSGVPTPLHQPSPGQTPARTPPELSDSEDGQKNAGNSDESKPTVPVPVNHDSVALQPQADAHEHQQLPVVSAPANANTSTSVVSSEPGHKKSLDDFVILEEMGQGAYGQVKLARYKNGDNKVVLKFVTKRRILVDTWTRDRKLGTVPLEIHVLNYLRREDLKHVNIVDMVDFFEDDVNYYIEMIPHGLPGMDLFDYIELKVNMDENEAQSLFVQCARAVHHLHTKAKVVHRDIKDENVILDGAGIIKLIDFGSSAYIKNGPFNVFVGTIDYAAPEVLSGMQYDGRAQDVWALGILLYTIIYKENPFYSIDEIMDHDLRVPWQMSDDSVDLIRHMLTRPVGQRYTMDEVLAHPWLKPVL